MSAPRCIHGREACEFCRGWQREFRLRLAAATVLRGRGEKVRSRWVILGEQPAVEVRS
jgi:hypothetical protein